MIRVNNSSESFLELSVASLQEENQKLKIETINLMSALRDAEAEIKNLNENLVDLEQLKVSNAALSDKLKLSEEQVLLLETENKELKNQLKQDSTNSHFSSSTDRFGKQKKHNYNLNEARKQPPRAPGEKRHQGKTIERETPTDHVHHKMAEGQKCKKCGKDLKGRPVEEKVKQEFEIPTPRYDVIDHHIESVRCNCGCENDAAGSPTEKSACFYGENVKALVAYLSLEHHLPDRRIVELVHVATGLKISPTYIAKVRQDLVNNIENVDEKIEETLRASKIVHADESKIKCSGKRYWFFGMFSDKFSLVKASFKKRDVVEKMKNYLVCDGFLAYKSRNPEAQLVPCLAHICRDLLKVADLDKELWAKEFYDFLCEVNHQKYTCIAENTQPDLDQINQKYDELLAQGYAYHHALPPLPQKKKGRPKNRKGFNVLETLKHKEHILQFIHKFELPFTNNLAEQGIRFFKIKQDVSKTFRSEKRMQEYFSLRSVIASAKKQNINILDFIRATLKGEVLLAFEP